MIKVTSATVFMDAVGMRLSFTYSEIDDATGTITSDNHRVNRVINQAEHIADANAILDYAQSIAENMEV